MKDNSATNKMSGTESKVAIHYSPDELTLWTMIKKNISDCGG